MAPDTLVLGPGGLKGFMILGALYHLNSIRYLDQIRTICGCSVGSIIGLLYVIGYSPIEILEFGIDINIYDDHSLDLKKIIEQHGIGNQHMRTKLSTLIRNKYGFIPSMSQIYELTGVRFIAVALNISKGIVEYFDETYLELSCLDAVLMSSNIPGIFQKMSYKGCKYYDGIFANPYPVDYLDDGFRNILGIYIENDFEEVDNRRGEIISEAKQFYAATINARVQEILTKCSRKCLHIPLRGIETGLLISDEDKGRLFSKGIEEAKSQIPISISISPKPIITKGDWKARLDSGFKSIHQILG